MTTATLNASDATYIIEMGFVLPCPLGLDWMEKTRRAAHMVIDGRLLVEYHAWTLADDDFLALYPMPED